MRNVKAAAIALLIFASGLATSARGADSIPYPSPETYSLPGGYFACRTAVRHF
jgi:hypothetical protein